MSDEQKVKIEMGHIRLTGDQSQRLLDIGRNKCVECYEYWDWKLRDLGLVEIGPIPPMLKAQQERWLAQTWQKVRNMVGAKVPTLAKLREIEGLLNQMHHRAYSIDKQYSSLTDAGKKLVENGRSVILSKDVPRQDPIESGMWNARTGG